MAIEYIVRNSEDLKFLEKAMENFPVKFASNPNLKISLGTTTSSEDIIKYVNVDVPYRGGRFESRSLSKETRFRLFEFQTNGDISLLISNSDYNYSINFRGVKQYD